MIDREADTLDSLTPSVSETHSESHLTVRAMVRDVTVMDGVDEVNLLLIYRKRS